MKKFLLIVLLSSFTSLASAADYPPVIASYLGLQEKLAADTKLEKAQILDFKNKALLTKNGDLIGAIDKLAGSSDLDAQRENFKAVSSEVIQYAEEEKISGVYKANCPMAKADWLQASAEVKNPYYGSKMLKCGSSEKL